MILKYFLDPSLYNIKKKKKKEIECCFSKVSVESIYLCVI